MAIATYEPFSLESTSNCHCFALGNCMTKASTLSLRQLAENWQYAYFVQFSMNNFQARKVFFVILLKSFH